jgi:TolB-like protein
MEIRVKNLYYCLPRIRNKFQPIHTALFFVCCMVLVMIGCKPSSMEMVRRSAPATDTVAVAFENDSSSKQTNDPLVQQLTDYMISDLSQSKTLCAVPSEIHERLIQILVKQFGSSTTPSLPDNERHKVRVAKYFIFGSYIVNDDQIVLTSRLVSVQTSQILAASSVTGPTGKVRVLERHIAIELLRRLDPAVAEQEAHSDSFQSPPVQASYYYKQGLLLEQQGKYQRALDCYIKALSTYPHCG